MSIFGHVCHFLIFLFYLFLQTMDSIPAPEFPPATFTMDENGNATLFYEGKTHTFRFVRFCRWGNSPKCCTLPYVFYVHDDVGGWPYFTKHKETLQQLIDTYRISYGQVQQKRLGRKKAMEAKAAAEAVAEAAAARIFPIKGSAAPTNPWKKPA